MKCRMTWHQALMMIEVGTGPLQLAIGEQWVLIHLANSPPSVMTTLGWVGACLLARCFDRGWGLPCVPCFYVLAPPNLGQAYLMASRLPPWPITCASPHPHARALEPHAFEDTRLVWVVVGVVRVGVGALCLGGGLPSLLPSLFLVCTFSRGYMARFAPSLHGVVLGF